jgi:anti-sigma regulatory factor (Ser/Thr protein kinase)
VELETRSLTIAAESSCLREATQFVRAGAREAKLPEERIEELDLLLEEAVINVCRYAYPPDKPGSLTLSYSIPMPGKFNLEIADQGAEFDPLAAVAPDVTLGLEDRPIGGLGIFLLREFASSISYRREDGWNRLTIGVSAGR